MANHNKNYTNNVPNDLSSAQEGQQFSFSSSTNPSNQPPVLFNPSPSSVGNVPRATLSNQELQAMALQLQNTAHWLGQMLQQRGLNTPIKYTPYS